MDDVKDYTDDFLVSEGMLWLRAMPLSCNGIAFAGPAVLHTPRGDMH